MAPGARQESLARFRKELEEQGAQFVNPEGVSCVRTDMVFRIQVPDEMDAERLDDALSDRWKPSAQTHSDASAYETEADQGPIGSTQEAPQPIRREEPKVGRNDPCPCGSGKKYKHCHGKR